MREMARFAPFEASRPVIAGLTGGDAFDVSVQAAIDLGIAAGAGAVIGAFRGGGAGPTGLERERVTFPGMKLDEPIQLQLRGLRAAVEGGVIPQEGLESARRSMERLRMDIRAQAMPGGNKNRAIGALELGDKATGPKELSRLFRTTSPGASNQRLRPLRSDRDGFASRQEYLDILNRAGMPENWEELTLWPRILRAKSDSVAAIQARPILETMIRADATTFLAKEADDGMYMVAKYAGTGRPPSLGQAVGAAPPKIKDASTKDAWVIFKTDSPGKFSPSLHNYANKVIRHGFKYGGDLPPTGLTGAHILDAGNKMVDEVLPWANYVGLDQRRSTGGSAVDAAMRRLGLDNVGVEAKSIQKKMKDFLREHLSPFQFQFSHSPRANYIATSLRGIFDAGELQSKGFLMGEPNTVAGRSLWKEILKGESFEKGVIPKSLNLNEQQYAELTDAWYGQMTASTAKGAGASDEVVDLLETLQKMDSELSNQLQLTRQLTDGQIVTELPNHFEIARTWRGNLRLPIVNEGNEVVAYAAGKTRKEVLEEADLIIDSLGGQGYRVRRGAGEINLADRSQDLDLAAKITTKSGEFKAAQDARLSALRQQITEERATLGGYKSNITKDDFHDLVTAYVSRGTRNMADATAQHKLGSQMALLSEEDIAVAQQVRRRWNDLAGRPGKAAIWQNRLVDKVLGNVLGKNSATKIVSVANTAIMNLQLGSLNLGFPVLNALTFMQTTLPHMHYIMSAPPGRLARYYSWWPVAGQDLRPKGGMGVLDTFKVMRQSMRELGKPDEQLAKNFLKATNEGVVDPRLVEEYAGQTSNTVKDLKGAVQGPGQFAGWLRGVSEFLPGLSEKFARGHSFTVGHILGRDFLKFEGDQLYRFAKDFTNRTMFLYGTADRARVMTAPLGSLFGMFKNWQMHYIHNFLEYTGEGISRGNWKPLLWMMGGTGAVGGIAAQPLFGVADAMSKWMSDETLMEWLYDSFGSGDPEEAGLADALFLGLPAYLPTLAGMPGFSMSGQAAAPFNDPARDAAQLFSFVHVDRMRAVGRAAGTAFDNWAATGEHPANSTNVRDQLLRAFAPKSFYRSAAVIRDNAVRSLTTSYPQVGELSLAERVMYGAGFNPRRVELQYRIANELWRDQNKMRQMVQAYGKAWAEAQASGEYGELNNLMQRAMADGVDVSAVLRSAQTRLAKGREDMIERQFDPAEVWRFRRIGMM